VQTLFCLLLSVPRHALRLEQLAEALWPEVEATAAHDRLRSTLYQLRQILDLPNVPGSHLSRAGDQILLLPGADAGDGWLDATSFEQLAATALASRDLARCRRAIDAYGGDYLPDLLYEDWAVDRRMALRACYLSVLRHGARLDLEAGAPEEAEGWLRRLLALEPADEEATCALMALLHAEGRNTEGVRVYAAFATALADELGVEPEPDTRRLREQLEVALHRPVASAVLPPRTTDVPTNLPAPISSFVGRRAEQATVRRILLTSRLVTLTGVGGVGKTRLALAVGTSLQRTYQDGVWLVELAALPAQVPTARELVYQSVARALGLTDQAGCSLHDTITAFLCARHLLLVLDNCEHVIAGCAVAVQALLEACPHLVILATSREPLALLGEVVWTVPPLSLPVGCNGQPSALARVDAVQLFLERVRARHAASLPHPDQVPLVARICQRLDGIPLAIELAAARLPLLSLEQIVARLDDRFSLLIGGSRTAAPRQQTLCATMEWSYALLTEAARTLLRRLAMFAGDWNLGAAESICADELEAGTPMHSTLPPQRILQVLGALAAQSLVQVDAPPPANVPAEPRYRLLETVRQYALERLGASGEWEPIMRRHFDWCLDLARQADLGLRTTNQLAWLDRLEMEHDNLRQALRWSLARPAQPERAVALAAALWQFWYLRNYLSEGRAWLEQALAAGHAEASVLRAKALNGAGALAFVHTDLARATTLLEASVRMAEQVGDSAQRAIALTNLASVAARQGDHTRATALYEQSLQIFRLRDDQPNVAAALYNTGLSALDSGAYVRGIPLLEESLALYRQLGNPAGIALALALLGRGLWQSGHHGRVIPLLEQSLALARQVGSYEHAVHVLMHLAAIQRQRGSYQEALARYREGLQLARDLGQKASIAEYLEGIAGLVAAQWTDRQPEARAARSGEGAAIGSRDAEWAVQLLGAAATLRVACGIARQPAEVLQFEADLAELQALMGRDTFALLWALGQRWSVEDAIDCALGGEEPGPRGGLAAWLHS
jgi:predicted ATPase/DNA-binding SARP family transcriptional activator